MNNLDTDNSSDKVQEVLDVIKVLQTTEQGLQDQLTENGSDSTLTDVQRESLITQINELAKTRVDLYNTLETSYGDSVENVADSKKVLADQGVVLGILENQMNEAKYKLKKLNEAKNNKLKMVEINSYFSKDFSAKSGIMKSVFFYFVIICIVLLLGKFRLIPANIANGLIAIVLLYGALMTLRKLWDITKRRPDNYDEIDWWWSPGDLQNVTDTDPSNNWSMADMFKSPCVDSTCCAEGTIWDPTKYLCISDPSLNIPIPVDDDINGDINEETNDNTDNNLDVNVTLETFRNYLKPPPCGRYRFKSGPNVGGYNPSRSTYGKF